MLDSPDFDALRACDGVPDDALLDRLAINNPKGLALYKSTIEEMLINLRMKKKELAENMAIIRAIDQAFERFYPLDDAALN